MEFENYGPLAQSKDIAENKKNGWIPFAITLGVGVLIGCAWLASLQRRQLSDIVDKNKSIVPKNNY
jgi:hypothetical protein